jgi:hypothetical protein
MPDRYYAPYLIIGILIIAILALSYQVYVLSQENENAEISVNLHHTDCGEFDRLVSLIFPQNGTEPANNEC